MMVAQSLVSRRKARGTKYRCAKPSMSARAASRRAMRSRGSWCFRARRRREPTVARMSAPRRVRRRKPAGAALRGGGLGAPRGRAISTARIRTSAQTRRSKTSRDRKPHRRCKWRQSMCTAGAKSARATQASIIRAQSMTRARRSGFKEDGGSFMRAHYPPA